MFTSIEKVFKIQTFFYHNPHHGEIFDSIKYISDRDPTIINHLISLHRSSVAEIMTQEG